MMRSAQDELITAQIRTRLTASRSGARHQRQYRGPSTATSSHGHLLARIRNCAARLKLPASWAASAASFCSCRVRADVPVLRAGPSPRGGPTGRNIAAPAMTFRRNQPPSGSSIKFPSSAKTRGLNTGWGKLNAARRVPRGGVHFRCVFVLVRTNRARSVDKGRASCNMRQCNHGSLRRSRSAPGRSSSSAHGRPRTASSSSVSAIKARQLKAARARARRVPSMVSPSRPGRFVVNLAPADMPKEGPTTISRSRCLL